MLRAVVRASHPQRRRARRPSDSRRDGGATHTASATFMGTMKENAMERTRAILVDITKCIGCRSCEQACKEVHGFPKDTEAKLSTTALTVIEEHGDKYVRRMCMHCQDPACASRAWWAR